MLQLCCHAQAALQAHGVRVPRVWHAWGHEARHRTDRSQVFWPKCFLSDNYHKMYKNKSLRQPEVYSGKYLGPDHLRVLRPTQRPKKRGRPKKKRYTWKRRTVASVAANMTTVTHAQYHDVLEFF